MGLKPCPQYQNKVLNNPMRIKLTEVERQQNMADDIKHDVRTQTHNFVFGVKQDAQTNFRSVAQASFMLP